MTDDDVVIIGAGPCGLTLSSLHPERTRIFEQENAVGGLCRSLEFGGAVFDLGGHSFHSPHPEVVDFVETLMQGRWQSQRRDARVMVGRELIDYPFQQNIHQISDATIRAACETGRLSRRSGSPAGNFHDWIVDEFGEGVADHFMMPYNRKLWARDLHRIGREWVGERVALTHAAPSEMSQAKRKPLQSQSEVAYPSDGGFGVLFETLAERCGPIALSQRVVAIDPVAKTVTTDKGEVARWRRLVSTMPLPTLLAALDDCPTALTEAAASLEFVSLKLVLIAVGEGVTDQPQRIYSADPKVPAHKIAFNHTSSPALRRRPAQSVICEVSYSADKPSRPDAELEAAMIDWLKDNSLIAASTPITGVRTVDLKYGYPVPTPGLPATRAAILDDLQARDIYSIGRFGAWEYVNSDACIWRAMRLADTLYGARDA